jgi:transcriptional regulator with XRE-family HTH domain
MTTAVSAVNPGETLTQAVARRLRGQLAEQRISQLQLCDITGWGRMYIGRRLSGETPIDTADLEHIESTIGISVRYLVTGELPAIVAPFGVGVVGGKALRRRSSKAPSRRSTHQSVDWHVSGMAA